MDPVISPNSDTMMQPSGGQDITLMQPSTDQDITLMQPSEGQDITLMQPSEGQDITLMQPSTDQDITTRGPQSVITDLNSVSSDEEVTIISGQQVEEDKGPFIRIESSDDEEQLEIKDLSKKTKIDKTIDVYCADEVTNSPCSICLGDFDNKSFLDQCFHAFCFYCILQWSEIVRTCPLCKAGFSQIIHSVKSMTEYELHKLPANPNPSIAADTAARRFRYRTTSLGSRHVSRHNLTTPTTAWEERETRRERMLSMKRRKAVKAKAKRRSIYAKNLWVQTVTQSGRPKFRETSPQFFRSNPACTHRLVAWLTRELQCLLDDEPSHVEIVLQLVMTIITKIQIDSDDFIDELRPLLTDKTEHFAHEFLSYARSPFDMTAYDGRTQYNWPREHTQHVAETPLIVDISATGWESPDETRASTGLATFSSEPGPSGISGISGISGSIDVETYRPIFTSIDPPGPQHSADWSSPRPQHSADWSDEIAREQTVNQESDQNRNDIIDLSPEVIAKAKHRHKHKHRRRHKHKHRTRSVANGNVLECSSPSYVEKPPSSESNPLDVIVISSEGTGSPEYIEHTARCLDSTPVQRSSKSRSSKNKLGHSKLYHRRSRDSSVERSKSREGHQESRHRRTRTFSRSRDDGDLSHGNSSKSRDHSRRKRSRSSSAESRTDSGTLVSKLPFESRDCISLDDSKDLTEEGVTRPSSPTEEDMKQEILELEKKIAEDTKRLEELIKKQHARNRGVGSKILSTEDSERESERERE